MPEGWRAGPFETVVVNGAFLGVHVPPGASRVELRFIPRASWPAWRSGGFRSSLPYCWCCYERA